MRARTAVLIFLFVSLAYGSNPAVATLTGRITDVEGAAIAQARVLLHWDSAGSTVGLIDNVGRRDDLAVFTDERGYYSAALPPGFYDVFITSTAFTPVAGKVRLKASEPSAFNAEMSADPLVTKELGDRF